MCAAPMAGATFHAPAHSRVIRLLLKVPYALLHSETPAALLLTTARRSSAPLRNGPSSFPSHECSMRAFCSLRSRDRLPVIPPLEDQYCTFKPAREQADGVAMAIWWQLLGPPHPRAIPLRPPPRLRPCGVRERHFAARHRPCATPHISIGILATSGAGRICRALWSALLRGPILQSDI
jgi:hypothetical protein